MPWEQTAYQFVEKSGNTLSRNSRYGETSVRPVRINRNVVLIKNQKINDRITRQLLVNLTPWAGSIKYGNHAIGIVDQSPRLLNPHCLNRIRRP